MYLNDERFGSVIYSTYGNEDALVIDGVYETVNDNWLIVERRKFEKMLRNGCVTFGVSLSEAKEQLRDEIIAEYLEQQAKKSEQKKTARLFALNKQRRREADVRRVQIVALMLQGFSKKEIQSRLNLGKTTVNKALHGLILEDVTGMYSEYKSSYFENVSSKQISDFIKADCDYKAYRRVLENQAQNLRQ